MHKIINNPTVM